MTPGKKGKVTTEEMSLVEVGPRVCLQPIKIFAGSFGGPVLYENPGYVSPNKVSAISRPDKIFRYLFSAVLLLATRKCRHYMQLACSRHGARQLRTRVQVCCDPQNISKGTIVGLSVCLLAQIRAEIKKQSAGKYSSKVKARGRRREHVAANPIPKDELGDVFK